MNLDQIETKCFILALFIRDDDERFLLGSRAYEFVDSQLHFAANTYQNDVVEVQGNDGLMLAGQVRRATSQAFDGYIGDSSVNRSTIEQYRRDFMKFFRKNHYYKVVYVFPDGTAIQRRNGFIVEAPEVKELYQLFPKYHISMNFEDINYYAYEEDSDGQEIYGESATLKIATSATGGLIWEEGTESEISGEGSQFTLQDTIDGNVLDSVQLNGDTTQQTYSGKNLLDPSTLESGVISAETGADIENVNRVRISSAGAIPVTGGSTYTVSTSAELRVALYAYNDSTFITGWGGTWVPVSSMPYTFITPSNATKLRIAFSFTENIRMYVSDVTNPQLELGSATPYEPYVGGIPAPNPDYPQTVNTVTGEQVVTISDGDSQSQSYTVNLGSIELCKIGTYQDYIYKSGSDWYVHKATGKVILNGGEANWGITSRTNGYQFSVNNATQKTGVNSAVEYFSDNFKGISFSNRDNQNESIYSYSGDKAIRILTNVASTVANFKTWLGTHNTIVYFILATATDTQITNADLITQLNALAGATTYNGKTVFTVTSSNQLAILDVTVIARTGGGVVWDNYGAEWEEGTGGGPTMVNIDSIDNVYPVLTLTGPAVNPQISVLTTNTTLSYSGTVTASQELKIDMFNKTATLNGASVVGNVSGDWVYLKPGVNRITYTTNNADAPDSTIWWQEIVG